jgi:hypothetical protein
VIDEIAIDRISIQPYGKCLSKNILIVAAASPIGSSARTVLRAV